MKSEYGLRVQFHSHDQDSNGENADSRRLPRDSPMSRRELIDTAYANGIDALFITNHNTLKGCREAADYAKSRYGDRMKVYPGEEVSALYGGGRKDTAHLIGLGMNEEVRRDMSIDETLDKLRSQAALVYGPHPFGCISSIGKKAKDCDIIEGFNPSNIDVYSDIAACELAKRNKKFVVAGGDSHTVSTVGKGVNIVYAENSLDSIIENVKKGRMEIVDATYNTFNEIREVVTYQFSEPGLFLADIRENRGPKSETGARLLINAYIKHPDNPIFNLMGGLLKHYLTKVSKKANIYDYNGDGMSLMKAPLKDKLMECVVGLDEKKFGHDRIDLDEYEGFLESGRSRVNKINSLNKRIRGTQLVRV